LLAREIQAEAKRKGLWAPGHLKEIGGRQGMTFSDYIYVNEVQGRSELASICLGTHSLPGSLMMHNHASTETKDRYLNQLVQVEIFPSFAMTEPELILSDPTGIKTYGDRCPVGRSTPASLFPSSLFPPAPLAIRPNEQRAFWAPVVDTARSSTAMRAPPCEWKFPTSPRSYLYWLLPLDPIGTAM
jgi:hypothetical protein